MDGNSEGIGKEKANRQGWVLNRGKEGGRDGRGGKEGAWKEREGRRER